MLSKRFVESMDLSNTFVCLGVVVNTGTELLSARKTASNLLRNRSILWVA